MTDFDRLAGALADRYKIERHLGEGGMATVYLAEDLKHERKVAVKVLRPELAAVLGAERFVKEIKTTANLQHPHILPLFDSGEARFSLRFPEGETPEPQFGPSFAWSPDGARFVYSGAENQLWVRERNSTDPESPVAQVSKAKRWSVVSPLGT